ncbi:transmembrane protein 33 [Octopus bimaculoides]|uniref:Transmembrane protein 33 n=1 Tax=Octopus bimaculoides TaxID=37653 RepID=A0A0L8HYA4_OCTBM|nr:transmembrane protein 33 [Octopus bimaculoides]|eukprot:XP_014768673.1 PREDICTED: transmembrane protein 33-like [Octopus bimaculoides]
MADEQTNTNNTGNRTTVWNYMMGNKVAASLWLTRIMTISFTILFVLPIFGGNSYSFYQRALLSNAATSALRLYQRLPNFQLNRQYFGQLIMEDSCHYLLYSLIFINSYPITMVLAPLFLFSLLHACDYTKSILNILGSNSLQFMMNLIASLELQQSNILRFIACNEIFLMPGIVLMIFSGKASLLLPFIYYRFITMRYSSRRNPYCRTLFHEMRITVETLCSKPQCPVFLKNFCYRGIALISRLAPQTNS